MSSKYISLDFTFEEVEDEYDEGVWSLEVRGINRSTNLSDDEINALGEEIGQSDRWQVDNWIAIQRILGEPGVHFVNLD